MKETWVDMRGYEGIYKVSDLGRVKSLERYAKRSDGRKQFVAGGYLSGSPNTDGYIKVGLSKNGVKKPGYIARIVAEHFIPNTENKPQVNHINGIKSDNRKVNLEWVTSSENIRHAFDTGLSNVAKGEKHVASKLTEKEVIEMRRLYKTGNYIYIDLAEKFDVARITVSRIITRQNWTHI